MGNERNQRMQPENRIAYCGVDCLPCPDYISKKCPGCRTTAWGDDPCPPVACCRKKAFPSAGNATPSRAATWRHSMRNPTGTARPIAACARCAIPRKRNKRNLTLYAATQKRPSDRHGPKDCCIITKNQFRNSARMASETSATRMSLQPWSATLLRAGIITVV